MQEWLKQSRLQVCTFGGLVSLTTLNSVKNVKFLKTTQGEHHSTHGKHQVRHERESTLTLRGHLKEKCG